MLRELVIGLATRLATPGWPLEILVIKISI